MQEIKIAMNLLIKNGTSKNKISVFCCTEYPANIKTKSNSIKYLKDKLKCRVGFSIIVRDLKLHYYL